MLVVLDLIGTGCFLTIFTFLLLIKIIGGHNGGYTFVEHLILNLLLFLIGTVTFILLVIGLRGLHTVG